MKCVSKRVTRGGLTLVDESQPVVSLSFSVVRGYYPGKYRIMKWGGFGKWNGKNGKEIVRGRWDINGRKTKRGIKLIESKGFFFLIRRCFLASLLFAPTFDIHPFHRRRKKRKTSNQFYEFIIDEGLNFPFNPQYSTIK